jgi:gliding motility-associated-like protein
MRILIIILLLSPLLAIAQIDESGPGRALYFDGFSLSRVDLGDSYNSLSFPFSISMWVRLDENKNDIAAIFASEEGNLRYRGFWVRVTKTNLGLGWGDGTGGNFEAFRRVKVVDVADISGKWVHMAFVAEADDEIEIYLNGVRQLSYWTGTSSLTMVNNFTDRATVGKMFTNGTNWQMKGYLDEIRLWDRIRTEDEIRRDMCRRIKGDQNGLIGYWSFDEVEGSITMDKSGSEVNGNLVAINSRPYSGAPIGDTSIYVYPATTNIPLIHEELGIEVTDITSNALGYHIYLEKFPTLEGLACQPDFYYGVYSFSNTTNDPDVKVQFTEPFDSLSYRETNFERSWISASFDQQNKFGFNRRTELVPRGELKLNLGDDLILCEGETKVIQGPTDQNVQLIWSDGSTEKNYTINGQTQIWAQMEGICGVSADTINITYIKSPEVSVDRDVFECNDLPVEIKLNTGPDVTVTWSDGRTGNPIVIDMIGTFSYEVSNVCGTVTGSIKVDESISYDVPPNVFTPNQDDFNKTFIVDESLVGSELTIFNRWGKEVYYDPSYLNNWTGKDLGSGTYYYKIVNPCIAEPIKGFVHILR